MSVKNKRPFFWGLLSAAYFLNGCQSGQRKASDDLMGSSAARGPMPYEVAPVYAGPATVYLYFPVTIKGEEDVEIRPKVEGFIQKIWVDEGAAVHKGQLLFQLRNPQYDAAVRNAASAVQIAQADLASAEMDVAKVKPLVDRKIISPFELQSKQNTLQAKQASLSSAQATLENARVDAAYTNITSPSDGTIGLIPYRNGSLVGSTSVDPLTVVYNTKNVYAYFSLNEKQLLGFLKGMPGTTVRDKLEKIGDVSLVLADGSEYGTRGRIVTVSGLISTATGSASFRANFANGTGLIRSGSSASIKIPIRLDSTLLIPQAATYYRQGQKFVYKVDQHNNVVNTAIQVSENSIGNLFVLESGVQRGDRIVVQGIASLRDGMPIEPTAVNSDSLYADARHDSLNSIQK